MEFGAIIPEIITVATAAVVLMVAIFLPRDRQYWAGYLALAGLLAATVFTVPIFAAQPTLVFMGTYAYDGFAAFFKLIAFISAALAILASMPHFRGHQREGEVYSLVVFVALGTVLLAGAADIMLITVGLVLASITSYILVGYMTHERRSQEASLKYFIFGSVSVSTMIYGFTFWYGFSGTTLIYEMPDALAGASRPLLYTAVVLVLSGLAFKASVIPMHLWVPDAYEGAPTPITAFISVGPKAAGYAALARAFVEGLPEGVGWPLLLAVVAAVTMTLGNVQMIPQRSVKRLLAYSSIAQAGYLLMGVVAFPYTSLGRESLLYYTLAYLFMNFGAFMVVQYVARRSGSEDLSAYSGLWRRSPLVAAGMVLLLMGLVGIPPLAGFFGKLLLFTAAIEAGFGWLAVVAIVNSVISLYPYLRIVGPMYLGKPGGEWEAKDGTRLVFGLVLLCVAATLVLGVYPQPFLELVRSSALFMP